MTMISEALDYHRRGWSLIPMQMQAKKPAVKWKDYQVAPADEASVRLWFGRGGGHYGIGVVFGPISDDLASRDFDSEDSYEQWAATRPKLANSLATVRTRRGRHVYFRSDQSAMHELRSAYNRPDGTGAIACNDGELRAGTGCYSVLPPSRHPSGVLYEWLIPLPKKLPIVDPVDAGLVPCPPFGQVNTENTVCAGELSQLTTLDESDGERGGGITIERAISRTLPTRPGQRHRCIFEFCRELKSFPAIADAPADSPILRSYFNMWFDQALPAITSLSRLESYVDFKESWDKVRFRKGTELINAIFSEAAQADPPKCAERFAEEPKVVALISLCRELQRLRKRKSFYLDCRTVGRLLHVSYVTAWRWLKGIEGERIIKTIKTGDRAKRKASEFKYIGDM